MPKRPQPFEAEAPEEEQERPSRSDRKRANRTAEEMLARLSGELVGLSPKNLASLGLPEEVLEAVLEAQAIHSPVPRNRQIRTVRTLLRDADWNTLQRRVTTLLHTGKRPSGEPTVAPAREREEAQWVTRMLAEGTRAVEAFAARFPSADRAHLEGLVRAVGRATPARRLKAEHLLALAVRSYLPR